MVRVHQLDLVTLRHVGECCYVAGNTLIGEVLEDLLQSGLRHAILFYAKVSLFTLETTEEPSDSLAFLWHAKLEEFTALLEDFNLVEVASQELQDAKSVSLSCKVLQKVTKADLIVVVDLGLNEKVLAKTILPDLAEDEIVKLSCCALVNCTLQGDLRLQVCVEAQLLSQLLQLVVLRLPHLDFDFVAHAELVLDVLRAAHAAEDASSDHDAELGRQRLRFFHRVGRQNDRRLLVALRYFLDDLPHEAPRLRVHAGGGLVKQDDGRVADEGHGDGELSLVATTERAGELVSVILQVQVFYCLLDDNV